MIEPWKLRRELTRLSEQAKALPLMLYEPIVQRRHDAARAVDIAVTDGAIAPTDRLAVFLLYQPNGVARSVLDTLRHLVSSGYSPFAVTNTPLSERDRSSLREVACRIMERPNFGYDFGGYRDGIWLVSRLGLAPRQVLFLNDSVWFPVTGGSRLLADMSDAPSDYVGTQVFGDPKRPGRKRGIFGSYCFMIKERVWTSDLFQGFWSDYRVSSSKEVTLRRGERALSQTLLSAGVRAEALFGLDRFLALVDGLDRAGLEEAIHDMVVTDPALVAQRDELLAGALSETDDEALRDVIRASARSKNYIGAAPVLSLRDLGFPMIKKNNERHYQMARHRILRAVDEGRLVGLDPTVIAEMRRTKLIE